MVNQVSFLVSGMPSLSQLQQVRTKRVPWGDDLLFIATHFIGLRSTKQTLPLQEMLVLPSVGKASPSHPQVLHQPQVLDLMPYEEVVKLAFGNTEGRVMVKDLMGVFHRRQDQRLVLIIIIISGLGLATDMWHRYVLLGSKCASFHGGWG